MELYTHDSYEDYVQAQIKRNKASINVVWTTYSCIKKLSKYMLREMPDLERGICHGVRNGWEVRSFKKALKCEILGTEISPTASQFPYIIQWDFHDLKDEWIGNIDFIYSNAFDHSYDPEKCLDTWMTCIKPSGLCFIEYHFNRYTDPRYKESGVTPSDCFNATTDEYKDLITKKYHIKQIITYTRKKRKSGRREGNIFVIQHPRS